MDNVKTWPKGERLPDTREAFEHLASQYEKAMLEDRAEIARLKQENNNLRQKLDSERQRNKALEEVLNEALVLQRKNQGNCVSTHINLMRWADRAFKQLGKEGE